MMDSFWCIQSLMSACFKLEKKFIIYACLSKDQQVFIIIDSNSIGLLQYKLIGVLSPIRN